MVLIVFEAMLCIVLQAASVTVALRVIAQVFKNAPEGGLQIRSARLACRQECLWGVSMPLAAGG